MTNASTQLASRKPIRGRFLIGMLISWIAILPVHAQSTAAFSAEDAVRAALLRPEIVQSLEAEIRLAQSEWIAARTWPNPTLQVERERPGETLGTPTETSVTLAQEFDFSGRRGLQRRAGELGVAAARHNVARARRELRAEVLRRYYAALAADTRVQLRARWAEGLTELARIAARRREAGDLSGYESRRIAQTAELAAARTTEAEAEREATRERLAGLVGERARESSMRLSTDLLPESLPPLEALLAALERTPELAALDAERTAAAAAARAAARLPLPVTLGVGQKRIETATGDDDALLLEASIPLPLFDRNQAPIARTRAAAARAEGRYLLAVRDAEARLRALWGETSRLANAARRLNATTLAEAEELVRIARASFEAGELELAGLLDAYDAALDAREQVLELQQRARLALIELEQLTTGDSS